MSKRKPKERPPVLTVTHQCPSCKHPGSVIFPRATRFWDYDTTTECYFWRNVLTCDKCGAFKRHPNSDNFTTTAQYDSALRTYKEKFQTTQKDQDDATTNP